MAVYFKKNGSYYKIMLYSQNKYYKLSLYCIKHVHNF